MLHHIDFISLTTKTKNPSKYSPLPSYHDIRFSLVCNLRVTVTIFPTQQGQQTHHIFNEHGNYNDKKNPIFLFAHSPTDYLYLTKTSVRGSQTNR